MTTRVRKPNRKQEYTCNDLKFFPPFSCLIQALIPPNQPAASPPTPLPPPPPPPPPHTHIQPPTPPSHTNTALQIKPWLPGSYNARKIGIRIRNSL